MGSTTTEFGSVRLHDGLDVIRRRKWTVLLAVIIVPAAAIAYSLHQPARYSARADVLLGQPNSVQSVSGSTSDILAVQDPQRVVDTETALAREPEVAHRVVTSLGLGDRTAEEFLAQSSVSAQTDTNLLSFEVNDRSRRDAVRLTNAYANQFAAFVHQLDTGALYTALARVQDRIALLNKTSPKSVVLASLLDKAEQLQTELALQTSNASVVRTASTASQTEPQPLRNGVLAVLLGLVLGIALAFLREALDTRVKNPAEAGALLHLPLLARIPRPPRRIRANERIVMLASAEGPYAEPYRVLRTNLEFANLDHKAKTIMITSGLEQEGKSTTAANLAVALAKAGKKVALVDLDLRRPFVHRFFDLKPSPGLTEVALGHVPLDSALTELVVSDKYAPMNGKPHPANTLLVLTSGQIPLDPGEFVASQALPPVLAAVAAKVDFVIVDSPPVLHVGDTLTLSALIDGIVVVTRLDLVRKRTLVELHRQLERCPAATLGFVAASAQTDEEAGYYSYSSYGQVPWPEDVPAEPARK